MLSLKADTRKERGKKARTQGAVLAVLYGPKVKPVSLSVDKKEFEKVFNAAGESSLVTLELGADKTPVLIREVQRHPLSGAPIHADFYQPRLDQKIKIMVPLVLEGEAPAQKDLEGTLIQNVHEVEVEALPQELPHEIIVSVAKLATFEDHILVKDLQVSSGVHILHDAEAIVAQVVPAEKVEEELAKPVEENVADVKVVKEEKKEKEEAEAAAQEPAKEKKVKSS
ncbi:MAG: 50S ribosomal protein L25 [bacterium]|nr:50S ribosomal protein L25 [bacterium]